MNYTPDLNSTTAANTTVLITTVTQGIASNNGSETKHGLLIGALVGAICGFIIITLLVVLGIIKCRRYRRKHKKPPPELPDPYARLGTNNIEPSRSDSGSSTFSSRTDSKYLEPIQQTWRVQEPVIHSPVASSAEERVSYILMNEPSRRISISPPSPGSTPCLQKPFFEYKSAPVPCRSPDGYVNVPKQKPVPSPGKRAESRTPSESTKGNEHMTDEVHMPVNDGDAKEDYENFKDILSSQKKAENASLPTLSLQSFSEPECSQQTSQRNSNFYENVSDNVPANENSQNGATGCREDNSTSDDDLQDCSDNEEYSDSYVNVHEHMKMKPGKQQMGKVDLPKSVSVKPESDDPKHERKPPAMSKPPGVLPKPKSGQQKSLTETSVSGIIQASVNHSDLDTDSGKKSRQENLRKFHENTKLCPVPEIPGFKVTNSDNSRKSLNKSAYPSSTKLLTPETRSGESFLTDTNSNDVRKYGQGYQNEVDVYQNLKSISASEPKLSSLSTDNRIHGRVTNFQNKLPNNQSNTNRKQSLVTKEELNAKADMAQKMLAPQTDNPSGVYKPPLQNKRFGSSPNVDSSGNMLKEIKSKLKNNKLRQYSEGDDN